MKPTHIIIPIEDIKKDLEELVQEYGALGIQKDIKSHNGISPQQRKASAKISRLMHYLRDLLSDGKQISLSEEDIEAKAYKYADELQDPHYENNSGYNLARLGFRQALKDLL